jgi:hypothetical protein
MLCTYRTSFPCSSSWLDDSERTLGKMKQDTETGAYEQLMKYGLGRNDWNGYLFLAYRNHRPAMILLEGFPDRPETLPHA